MCDKVEPNNGVVALVDSTSNGEEETAPNDTRHRVCVAAHQLLMLYANQTCIRHDARMVEQQIHNGVVKQVRFVQFKPHEQRSYNLHMAQVHVNEITSRGVDQDSLQQNKRQAARSYQVLTASCTKNKPHTLEQLLVLHQTCWDTLSNVNLTPPLTLAERDDLNRILVSKKAKKKKNENNNKFIILFRIF